MPKLLSWIAGYGILLIAVDAITKLSTYKLLLDSHSALCGWAGGVIVVVAGIAAMQGRRSLRLTGIYIALFLPLLLTGLFAWDAAAEWRRIYANAGRPMVCGISLTALAIISISMVALVSRLRPKEGIASRGYSVTLPSVRRPTRTKPAQSSQSRPTHSEAG